MIQSGTCAAIIVAAGRGERAGNPQDGPKQYRTIGKYPIIHWTLRAFLQHSEISTIVVVIHPDDHHLYAAAVSDLDGAKHLVLVDGGRTRQQSVLNGLEALEGIAPAHVLIHDGVRPFIDDELISEVLNALNGENAAVLPALPLADTIKKAEIDGLVASTVSREGLFAAQTPQGFHFQTILQAHRKASAGAEHPFTDDCSIAEWDDIPVKIVCGSPDNVKLTVARDIQMADEKLMRTQKGGAGIVPDVRTGNGYDVHALTAGNFVTLCGVDIPHDHGLLGHSDADVALHALTDALLATCGAGDIGDHFPPSDPQWKDARSDIFLNFAAEHVKKTGGTIMNADVTLICEAPKIGPHRQSMRQSLADILQIEIVRCSVKATTNEGIGFVGRREGIAAIATATVVFSELNNDR